MKIVLYTALTVNGLITKNDNDTNWLSKEDNEHFNSLSRKIGAVVFGRKSWEEMNPNYLPFPEGEGLYIILTRNPSLQGSNPKTIFTGRSPSEILQLAQDQGYSEILVAGGGQTYGFFLNSGLVDEIYVDVEPYIFGRGIRLFPDSNLELNLQLLETKNLSPQTVQLHYKVVK